MRIITTPRLGKEGEEVRTEVSEVSEAIYLSEAKNDDQEQNTK